MITIDQLLESVDLDFEPRFVTKNKNECIYIWGYKPRRSNDYWTCDGQISEYVSYNHLKLAEFDGKDWTECIYEVPRKDKPVVKIEKLQPTVRGFDEKPSMPTATDFLNKINELVDAVNELKGAKNE